MYTLYMYTLPSAIQLVSVSRLLRLKLYSLSLRSHPADLSFALKTLEYSRAVIANCAERSDYADVYNIYLYVRVYTDCSASSSFFFLFIANEATGGIVR